MKEKENVRYWSLGTSAGVTLLCFVLIVSFIIYELTSGDVGSGVIMLFGWTPIAGLVILEIIVYVYGLYCRKSNPKEAGKMCNSTSVFGILISGYMIVVGMLFLCTNFQRLKFYLIIVILGVLNFVFLIMYKRKLGRII